MEVQTETFTNGKSAGGSVTAAALAVSEPQDDQAFLQDVSAHLADGGSDLQVSSVLGRGAFGVVYVGRWRSLPVAVKTLILRDVEAGPEGRQRQQAVLEAAISLSMAHENLVATYTYLLKPLVQQPPSAEDGAADGGGSPGRSVGPDEITVADGGADAHKLYIVQELCNGGSLRQALARGMAGSVRNGGSGRLLALRLALDVARGVAHVHACRIVHGDLKPASARDSGFPALTAKVADFGLSLPLPEDATHHSKRYQGTPSRTAPEVAAYGRLSQRSDAWSYGTMLIELFYGCTFEDIAALYANFLEARFDADGTLDTRGQYRRLCTLLLQDMFTTPEHAYTMLTASCFAPEPHDRPTFGTIVTRLEEILSEAEN
ncbi:hypothetical protein GPECTOR_38g349 [Gonium pectorale]|uniref:Protein kinase domain-containing protein n=1 Tax=Gonium pectorale TaxID=33097 RepID=A0A150GBA4_GONPE|nr:hypothetical protein GPECTOR_38g349 [Gonium pectorale]|eukprot:KXZ47112.1 hypothetical protein GPECTOR_38g349 [Gonium pectorale]